MDEYDWDEWDNQASEYLGSDDYTGGFGESDTGSNWGPPEENNQDNFYTQPDQPPSYDYGGNSGGSFGTNPFGPTNDWSTSITNPNTTYDWMTRPVAPETPNGMYDFNTGTTNGSPWGPSPDTTNPYTGSFGDFGLTNTDASRDNYSGSGGFNPMDLLTKLFGGGQGGNTGGGNTTGNRNVGGILSDLVNGTGGNTMNDIGNILSRIIPFFAANEEKKSSGDYLKGVEDILKENRGYLDPFAGERRQYMDLLKNSSDRLEGIYNSPTSSPFYTQAMNEAMRRAPRQLSKNRFGMGVNRMMSQQAPEIMRSSLDDARKTFDMYKEPSGANIRPQMDPTMIKALIDATKSNETNPMWSAIGQLFQGGQNNSNQSLTIDQIRNFLNGGK